METARVCTVAHVVVEDSHDVDEEQDPVLH